MLESPTLKSLSTFKVPPLSTVTVPSVKSRSLTFTVELSSSITEPFPTTVTPVCVLPSMFTGLSIVGRSAVRVIVGVPEMAKTDGIGGVLGSTALMASRKVTMPGDGPEGIICRHCSP